MNIPPTGIEFGRWSILPSCVEFFFCFYIGAGLNCGAFFEPALVFLFIFNVSGLNCGAGFQPALSSFLIFTLEQA
jgi:hypothetical protein